MIQRLHVSPEERSNVHALKEETVLATLAFNAQQVWFKTDSISINVFVQFVMVKT
jgi:hypothetical protein